MASRLYEFDPVYGDAATRATADVADAQWCRSVRVDERAAGEREAGLHPLAEAALLAVMTSPVWLPCALFLDLLARWCGC